MNKKRTNVGSNIDPSSATNNEHNEHSGAKKIIQVGYKLLPLKSDATTQTTSATTPIGVGKGVTLAVYNNTGTVASITTGDSTVAAQAAGAVQAATPSDLTPFVGVPVPPHSWHYVNTYDHTHVVTTASCMVFIVADDTHII